MRTSLKIGTALLALLCAATIGRAEVAPVTQPGAHGDQLIFYYDARAGFTTFVNVHNFSAIDVDVRLSFYNAGFDEPFRHSLSVPSDGVRVVDVGGLRAAGLPQQFGIALADIVNDAGQPIVDGELAGNFTVANLATGSAWGAAAPARAGRKVSDGSFADDGSVIDNTTVALEAIQPSAHLLAAYYNPQTLAPAASHGNQVIFISFQDLGSGIAGERNATDSGTQWSIRATRGSGEPLAEIERLVDGVEVVDLVSLLGDTVNGAPGRIRFSADPPPAPTNRLIFFAEALGTFGTGYLLPPLMLQ